jgi:hypothetical protein
MYEDVTSNINEMTLENCHSPSVPASLPPTSLIIGSRSRPQFLLDTVESVLQGDEVPAKLIIDQRGAPHRILSTVVTDCPCKIQYV